MSNRKTDNKKSGRVYVCHTFYHVFVALLKELNIKDKESFADIILSTMSNDFGGFDKPLKDSGVFRKVLFFEEKNAADLPELDKYKTDKKNIVLNMISRIKFTRKLAKAQEDLIPTDFDSYEDIYVFCDADPIGYYLNKKKIHYHAVEDGLNNLKKVVKSKYDNRGCFGLKKFFSMKLNLIFIRDGYSKYCIDMEVNDRECINDQFYKYKEVPRQKLIDGLGAEEKNIIIRVFVKNYDELIAGSSKKESDKKNIIVLTEPLCTLDVRRKIFEEVVEMFSKEGKVFLKPHPRDELDYSEIFPDIPQFDKRVPMEVFNFFEDFRFDKIVSIFTQLGLVRFADEKVNLGDEFMDKYEAPEKHFAGWGKV